MKIEFTCYKYVGVIGALINTAIFIRFFVEAIDMDAQYQLLWIPLSFIDFPTTLIYFGMTFLGFTPNMSAFISFGILGTIWWYFLAGFFARKFCRMKRNKP